MVGLRVEGTLRAGVIGKRKASERSPSSRQERRGAGISVEEQAAPGRAGAGCGRAAAAASGRPPRRGRVAPALAPMSTSGYADFISAPDARWGSWIVCRRLHVGEMRDHDVTVPFLRLSCELGERMHERHGRGAAGRGVARAAGAAAPEQPDHALPSPIVLPVVTGGAAACSGPRMRAGGSSSNATLGVVRIG